MAPPKRFRIQSKNYFLAYPNCSLSKEETMEQLIRINCSSNKKFIRVARELHENGEPHLHVLLQFEGKCICTNQRLFDLVSPTRSAHFHPNIQGAKSVKSYMEKEGDYSDWGEFQMDGRCARGGQQTANDAYAQALNKGSKSEALNVIKELAPTDYAVHFRKINSNLDRIFTCPPAIFISKWDSTSFRITDDMEQWLGEFFISDNIAPGGNKFRVNRDIDRPMSLIIEGPSRTGKTQWARSLGRHNYISGHLDLNPKSFSNDAEYNVIDDVAPKYLERKHWKELIGAKHDWQGNCRYGRPIQIKGGIPSIVVCNPGEGSSYKDFLAKDKNTSLRNWTHHNAYFVFIQSPLYNSQHQNPAQDHQNKEEQN